MARISRFVLVSPTTFYTRKRTYMCTACGRSFSLDVDAPEDACEKLQQEHDCHPERAGTATGAFPILRLWRDTGRR